MTMRVKAKKFLSQNFLVDKRALDAVVESISLQGKKILEIGAGTGNLTEKLAEHAKHVTSVEKDRRFIRNLEKLMRKHRNVEVVFADILEFDLSPYKTIVGSIPFHISSPILFKILNSGFSEAVLVLQKEFALRLTAEPDTSEWSRLSAMAQSLADIAIVGEIPRESFVPKPKVDSAIVVIRANRKFNLDGELVKTLFQHKNQSVRNALLHSTKALKVSSKDLKLFLESVEKLAEKKVRSLSLNELQALSNQKALALPRR